MLISVNANDPIPIYRQLVSQIRHAVASGRLTPGEKLPSQRELSGELVINHLTVKKAYETLEAEGLICTVRGRGTFVADSSPGDLKEMGVDQLRSRASKLALDARQLGMPDAEYTTMLAEAWQDAKERSK